MDYYWIHSALKDVSIFERIWDELDIERINTDIRIGVERYFSSAIPHEIKKRIEAQKKLLDAIAQGQRNIEGLKFTYRASVRKTRVSPIELVDLMMRLVSGDFFSNFVGLDSDSFVLGSIQPQRELTSIVPERVKINVLSDLNYKSPAAKGNLTFERRKYVDNISKMIDEYIPQKKKK